MNSSTDRARSILDTRDLTEDEIQFLFHRAAELEINWKKQRTINLLRSNIVSLLFFESSTRTRISFQIASARMGYTPIATGSMSESSLEKGETLADTVLNIAAMRPDAIVIRYGQSTELDRLLPTLDIPVINAGSGVSAHPTQALLDAFTIWQERPQIKGQRVLIVGDVRHSRVAHSNFELLSRFGAEVAICGPKAWMPQNIPNGIQRIDSLDEALKWADIYMGLRVQRERHGEDAAVAADFAADFGLNHERLKKLADHALILHPGPINYGVEFTADVAADPRNRVLRQVTNGVLIRAALLEMVVDGKPRTTGAGRKNANGDEMSAK